jgi:hypothetical protein
VKIRLFDIAHARSGDKGNTANIGVIARKEDYYPLLVRYLTVERVRAHFDGICRGRVERFEMPNLGALNFVLYSALGGGGTRSLRNDSQGKTFSSVLLRMELDLPDDALPEFSRQGCPTNATIPIAEGVTVVEEKREMLRHTVATVAYRGGKTLRGVPDSFAAFRIGPTTRTPVQILAHVGDLFDWALSIAKGEEVWRDSTPLLWPQEIKRFFAALYAFDEFLASGSALQANPEKLFQGPVADALTHMGQIAMLRRLAEAPIRGESYFRADIAAGRVGPSQAPPRREFD